MPTPASLTQSTFQTALTVDGGRDTVHPDSLGSGHPPGSTAGSQSSTHLRSSSGHASDVPTVTNTHRSRLSFLLIVLLGTIAVPVLSSTAAGVELFSSGESGGPLVAAPPPFLFVVLGVVMVIWAVGRRHLKSSAALRAATRR